MRLAIVLIAYLAAAGVLATLVPQGMPLEEYRSAYPEFLANLILRTGFDHFFTNRVFFWAPAFLFFANLSACTVDRFLREIKKKKNQRRHGPDILHEGLMLLFIGAVFSFSGHGEGSVALAPGGGARLPDGSTLELLDFRFERYPDGRPKEWISVVRLTDPEGIVRKDKYEIKVNSPLRYKGLSLYQASYVPADPKAAGMEGQLKTVIQAVRDPGYFLALPAMLLVALGTAITFFQKIKEGV